MKYFCEQFATWVFKTENCNFWICFYVNIKMGSFIVLLLFHFHCFMTEISVTSTIKFRSTVLNYACKIKLKIKNLIPYISKFNVDTQRIQKSPFFLLETVATNYQQKFHILWKYFSLSTDELCLIRSLMNLKLWIIFSLFESRITRFIIQIAVKNNESCHESFSTNKTTVFP